MNHEPESSAFSERWLNGYAIAILLLFLGAGVGAEVSIYRMGLTCWESGWWAMLLVPVGFVLLFLSGVVPFVALICFRRVSSIAALCPILVFVAALSWVGFERSLGPFFLVGFRDRVKASVSLDDLRRIRDVIVATREKPDDTYHQVTLVSPKSAAASFDGQWDINTGDTGFAERWQTIYRKAGGQAEGLCGIRGGRCHPDLGRWLGALGDHHWNQKVEPRNPTQPWFRLADDILVFSGD